MAEMFRSGRAEGPLAIAERLDSWPGNQQSEAGLRAPCDGAIHFWKTSIHNKTPRAVRHSQILTVLT
jgi:hypothetical protein